jgi:DNA gyrase/topoisomerase IV subunit B
MEEHNMSKKVNAKDFVTESFEYLSTLSEVSINRSTNMDLLEYIAYGFAKYGDTPQDFEKHVDDWVRMLIKVYPELKYDHDNHQIKAVIDLHDQLVVIDDDLVSQLKYIINVQKKYGLLVKYPDKNGNKIQTTISKFFEYVEKMYPAIKARYKGLGSSAAVVSKEVIMDPKTRRLLRVTMDDAEIISTMGMLVGDGKENKNARKEMLMNFKFDMSMIDN